MEHDLNDASLRLELRELTDRWNCKARTSFWLWKKYEPTHVSKSTKAGPRWVPIAPRLPLTLQSAVQMVHSEETFPWRLDWVTMYGSSARLRIKSTTGQLTAVYLFCFLVSRFYKWEDHEKNKKIRHIQRIQCLLYVVAILRCIKSLNQLNRRYTGQRM